MKKKPFKTYPGGKEADGTYQNIINLIPPHDIYIDGCLGKSAIMRHKKPAPVLNFGIDLDAEVIEAWKEFGQFSFFFYQDDITNFLTENIIDLLTKAKRIFIFIDPPYPASVRKTKRRIYKHEMLENHEHIHLLHVVRQLADSLPQRVYFMVCSYENEIYNNALHGWEKFTFKSKTRRGSVLETLYMNYPTPKKLHDYRFIGTDYRDRWRIKTRIERNVDRLIKMNPLERNAIIQAIKENETLKS